MASHTKVWIEAAPYSPKKSVSSLSASKIDSQLIAHLAHIVKWSTYSATYKTVHESPFVPGLLWRNEKVSLDQWWYRIGTHLISSSSDSPSTGIIFDQALDLASGIIDIGVLSHSVQLFFSLDMCISLARTRYATYWWSGQIDDVWALGW